MALVRAVLGIHLSEIMLMMHCRTRTKAMGRQQKLDNLSSGQGQQRLILNGQTSGYPTLSLVTGFSVSLYSSYGKGG